MPVSSVRRFYRRWQPWRNKHASIREFSLCPADGSEPNRRRAGRRCRNNFSDSRTLRPRTFHNIREEHSISPTDREAYRRKGRAQKAFFRPIAFSAYRLPYRFARPVHTSPMKFFRENRDDNRIVPHNFHGGNYSLRITR